MSISLNVVRWAVACCACSRFSAIRLRRVDIFSRVSRRSPPGREPAAAAAGGGAGSGVARAAIASSTSGLLTTPPSPVPRTAETSTPDAATSRSAAGESRAAAGADSRVTGADAGAAAGAGAGFAGAGAAAGRAGAGLPGAAAAAGAADSSSSASASSTWTVSPSACRCLVTTPPVSDGTSTVILSVSSSTMVSPGATASPSALSQRETMASVIDSPSGGTLMDVIGCGVGSRRPGRRGPLHSGAYYHRPERGCTWVAAGVCNITPEEGGASTHDLRARWTRTTRGPR